RLPLTIERPPPATLCPYTTLFRSRGRQPRTAPWIEAHAAENSYGRERTHRSDRPGRPLRRWALRHGPDVPRERAGAARVRGPSGRRPAVDRPAGHRTGARRRRGRDPRDAGGRRSSAPPACMAPDRAARAPRTAAPLAPDQPSAAERRLRLGGDDPPVASPRTLPWGPLGQPPP